MMAEVIPRLAVSLNSTLADAQVKVIGSEMIEITFDGLPLWNANVSRHLINKQYQMIETRIRLRPSCIQLLSFADLERLAASENLGLRGVTLLAEDNGCLAIKSSFMAQKGRTQDEIENLAIDVLTLVTFARTIEDRLTESSVGGQFSFELYQVQKQYIPQRFVSFGQRLFTGSKERVFNEVTRALQEDLSFQVLKTDTCQAQITAPSGVLSKAMSNSFQVTARIPYDAPIFVCHAPLFKLENLASTEIYSLLSQLNELCEGGHFEYNPEGQMLLFSSWKHLTNDLRVYSFDQVVFSVSRAFALAIDTLADQPIASSADIIPLLKAS